MKYVPQKKRRLGPACTGISTFLDLPYAKDAKILEEIDFAIAGVPFDTLVTFRPGCRFGPDAIRNAYGAQLYSDAFDLTLFDHIQGQKDGVPRKPDPTAVLSIAAEFGSDPSETLYIGDSEVDGATGKAAGMDTVLVTWGFRSRYVLEAAEPYRIVDSTDEILMTIKEKG